MMDRKRPSWLALGGAAILTLVLSSVVLGADPLALAGPTPESETDPLVSSTLGTWEDTDGNGIDDDCQETVEADPAAAGAADLAVDADGDGTISVTEAAHSDRVGGTNCNHGGYVSFVAGDDADDEESPEAEEAADEACVPVAAPTFDPVALVEPGGFGAYVSTVAQSDAIGGKNCNHGGAVSEAAKAAKAVVMAEREAAKAERAAERTAAKAEAAAVRATVKAERAADRAAARAERAAAKAERAAARAERQAGKPKNGG